MSEKPPRPSRLVDSLRKHVSGIRQVGKACSHRDQIQDVTPSAEVCAACLAAGDTWVHLRMCMICGNVGCCNDSKNKHASKHFAETNHPIMKSLEPGEDWMYCFIDETKLS
jgi:uncharacterized UBP type Zn finger protein